MEGRTESIDTEYGKFVLYKNDFILYHMKRTKKHWDSEKLDLFLPLIHDGDVIVDVGAHIGSHTVPYSKTVGQNGHVHAFEPQQGLFELLNINVQENCVCDNVSFHHHVLGHDNERETTMNEKTDKRIPSPSAANMVNYGGLSLGLNGEKIVMRSIDSFSWPRLDFLKVDVEGAEKLVLWGAKETIQRCRPIVVYEENYKKLTPDMIKMFQLSKEVIDFDIQDFFLKQLHYREARRLGKPRNCDWLMLP